MTEQLNRRQMLATSALGTAALLTARLGTAAEGDDFVKPEGFKGNIKQSVSRWCLGKLSLEECCVKGKKMGLVGIDLIKPSEWETVAQYGMIVTMGSMPKGGIPDGFNRVENHEWLVPMYEELIPIAAKQGVPNLICMSGNRDGMDDETAIKNCITGLKKIMALAEKHKITIQMELLNSKSHPDYHCDHTVWGVEVGKGVGSERFKLLYDIFHMQRMEGEIIETITKYKDYIGHYHTGGNPGRKDIDDSQELYYPAIMRGILETGYTGFVAHEFLPKKGLESIYNAIKICDV